MAGTPADGAGEDRQPPGTGAGEERQTPGTGDLSRQVAELQAEVALLDDRWRRALADLDNLRKRVTGESERQRADERARVAEAWLPVLDHLELALAHADADPRSVVDGVRAVRDQAVTVLDRLGFPRHDEVGVAFDPARHEAVAAVTDPQVPAGTVVEVTRPGYGDGERQLRPAAVIVATRNG